MNEKFIQIAISVRLVFKVAKKEIYMEESAGRQIAPPSPCRQAIFTIPDSGRSKSSNQKCKQQPNFVDQTHRFYLNVFFFTDNEHNCFIEIGEIQ